MDIEFNNLRLWKDQNLDGISQAEELTSLIDNQIVEIVLTPDDTSIKRLEGGNFQTAKGKFIRVDNSIGQTYESAHTANLELATDPFFSHFENRIPIIPEAIDIVPLGGHGLVRNLQEAASLSPQLLESIRNYLSLTSTQQKQQLEDLLLKWADTSEFKSAKQQAADLSLAGYNVSVNYIFRGGDSNSQEYQDLVRKIGIAERFLGYLCAGPNGQSRMTPLTPNDGNLQVIFGTFQVAAINGFIEDLATELYAGLLGSAQRLSSLADIAAACYADNVYLNLQAPDTDDLNIEDLVQVPDEQPVDFTALNNEIVSRLQTNPQDGILDLLEFLVTNALQAIGYGWNFVEIIEKVSTEYQEVFSGIEIQSMIMHLVSLEQERMNITTGSQVDIILANNLNNRIFSSDGDDLLMGMDGNDDLNAGDGKDLIYAGNGNDCNGQEKQDSYLGSLS